MINSKIEFYNASKAYTYHILTECFPKTSIFAMMCYISKSFPNGDADSTDYELKIYIPVKKIKKDLNITRLQVSPSVRLGLDAFCVQALFLYIHVCLSHFILFNFEIKQSILELIINY